ncbi:Zn finger protein [Ignicoccus pacificus DSM 13166]|uniref:Zn finger protein n=1 Tax=Ignicoccus pacificus DSM 13166 TaxID=940294 RepID=A0A977PKK8_9CREN|nr:Zn finger protein [Ignicoccus pacificus DSM 13166]
MRCYYCGRPSAKKCPSCGRPLCTLHDPCPACEMGRCEVCRERLSVSRCYYCGRLICRECSVELNPGIRVCKICYSKLDEVVRETSKDKEKYKEWWLKKLKELSL